MELLGYAVELPGWLRFANTPWGIFIANWLGWVVMAIVAYAVTRWLVHLLAQRSATRIDNALVSIIRGPLVVMLIAWGFLRAWETAFGPSDTSNALERLYRGVLIVLGARVTWRVLYEVVIASLRPTLAASDSQTDDIIIPLLSRIGPVIIIIAVANAVVTTLGGNLSALLASLGLLGLVLGYLFQEPLQGLFSGTYMALDNPFREDDLLILEDGATCQVRKIGVRVTQLYDVHRHVLLFVPNAKLAANRIVNLTKPSVELRTVVTVMIDRTLTCSMASALLTEACHAHENILGLWPDKEPAIRRRQAAYREACQRLNRGGPPSDPVLARQCFAWMDQIARLNGDLIRLQVEHTLREHCETMGQELLALAQQLSIVEDEGRLAQETERGRHEVRRLMDRFDELIEQITVWLYLVQMIESELTDQNYERSIASLIEQDFFRDGRLTLDELQQCKTPGAPRRPLIRRDELDRIRSSDGEAEKVTDPRVFADHGSYEDHLRFYTIWHRNILLVYRGLYQLYRQGRWDLDHRRLPSQRLYEIAHRFADAFLLRVAHWQLPFAKLVDANATHWKFEVAFFVDDVVREHYQRTQRVTDELLVEIERLRRLYTLPTTRAEAFRMSRSRWYRPRSREVRQASPPKV
jgi:small-conductance mechanosensitive channel